MTSYILYKKELAWLMNESGYTSDVFGQTDISDGQQIAARLAEKGILFEADGRYCVETTIAFLLYQFSEASGILTASDGVTRIFECPKMYIVLAPDPHNIKRCKLTPIQNYEQLSEYLDERGIEITNGGQK